jgi:starch synthase (maltosyl-transferring)
MPASRIESPPTTHSGSLASDFAAIPFPKESDRVRPVISGIRPLVDNGARSAKASVGDSLRVEADVVLDGHDLLRCEVRHRHASATKWSITAMEALDNDRYGADIAVTAAGPLRFTVRSVVDFFATWRRDLWARQRAGQDLKVELLVGLALIEDASVRAKGADRQALAELAHDLREGKRGLESPLSGATRAWTGGATVMDALSSAPLTAAMELYGDVSRMASSPTHEVLASPPKARFSTWYELFPRSAASDPQRHGTLADVESRLDYVADLGFDVLYLPPIHPIGRTGRKGAEGTPQATEGDPGSPWAIGAEEGGHLSVHPELGTLDDFDHLVAAAAERGIDVALDIAFQASPDHPWVRDHPQWFRLRPDGSIRHAENPPKLYEDIYPLDFDTPDWQALWTELLGVVLFWAEHGVRIFRVDNPHTKPLAFWEWLIASVKSSHPEAIFLAEAFTRPKVMQELGKLGFDQSYTYFTWRSSKWDIESYLYELIDTEMADYFRPNFWPNTPDILTEELQVGGRSAFIARLILAATLSSSYGVYGPAFELQEHVARAPGSEEYRHSEKYQLRGWDLTGPDSLADLIKLVNAIRLANPALQFNRNLRFHGVDNERLIAYSKVQPAPPEHANGSQTGDNVIVVVVNLDHGQAQSGWVDLALPDLGIDPSRPFVVRDLLTDAHYQWNGYRNFVMLEASLPAHIFAVEQGPLRETAAP